MTVYEAPILQSDDMPLVALESMNDTHREELALVNALAELVADGMRGDSDDGPLSEALAAWVSHTREHFERENQLMREHGFPALPVHSGEHSRVLEQIEDLQSGWLERRELKPLADFLFAQWPQWFDLHVNSMDAVTARFLVEQGA